MINVQNLFKIKKKTSIFFLDLKKTVELIT